MAVNWSGLIADHSPQPRTRLTMDGSTTPLPHTPSWCPQGLWYWTPRYQRWNFVPSFIVSLSETWPKNQITYLHYAYQIDTAFTKFSPTEYGGWVGSRAGLDVQEKRKLFALPGNKTPDSKPYINQTHLNDSSRPISANCKMTINKVSE